MELQWPLIIFTTLLAWSAGVFGTQCLYALQGKGSKAQMPALIASFVLMVVGGIAVFFHLQHWERIFNGFGHITSGITQELIALVVVFAVMVIFFVYLRRSGDEAKVPRWVAILGIVVSVILLIVMSHSYMMASRPAWNSVLQIGSIIGAACGFGPATMALLCALKNDDDANALSGTANIIGQALNTALTVIYIAAMSLAGSAFTQVSYWFDPVSPTKGLIDASATSPFAGDALAFTVLAIAGAVVGLVAAIMGKKQGSWKVWGAVAAIAVLVGAICLRTMFYQMGVSVYPFF